jgi:chromosome segregation ATPase
MGTDVVEQEYTPVGSCGERHEELQKSIRILRSELEKKNAEIKGLVHNAAQMEAEAEIKKEAEVHKKEAEAAESVAYIKRLLEKNQKQSAEIQTKEAEAQKAVNEMVDMHRTLHEKEAELSLLRNAFDLTSNLIEVQRQCDLKDITIFELRAIWGVPRKVPPEVKENNRVLRAMSDRIVQLQSKNIHLISEVCACKRARLQNVNSESLISEVCACKRARLQNVNSE